MKIGIIGTGNILFKDEGVGIYAGKFIEENYTFDKEIDIIDGGVLGFQLMTYYQEYDKIIIMDTITMPGEEAGSIYNLPAEELMGLGSYKQNAHEVEIVEMLEICSLLEKMANVNIIGIVPQDIIAVEIGLTERMKVNFANFIKAGLDELSKAGVTVTPKAIQKTIDDVISSYQNPQNRELHEDDKAIHSI